MLRVGIYLGRHAEFGGGMLIYAEELVLGLIDEFSNHNFTQLEVVLYGDQISLSEEFKTKLMYGPVVVSVGRFPYDGGANTHFKLLPNGAKCRVLIRQLPRFRSRLLGICYDLLFLPCLFLIDRLKLVHFTSNLSIFWCPCPVVLTLHDLFQGWPPVSLNSGLKKLKEYFFRIYFALQFNTQGRLNQEGAVITVSEQVKQQLIKLFHFEETRVRTIPLGLDRTFCDALEFFPSEQGKRALKNFLDSRQIVRGYVCILASADPRKNLERTLLAWLSLPDKARSKGVLIILSDPRSRGLVLSILGDEAGKDYVWIVEKCLRSELPYYLKAASVLLVPTLMEGFGLPALEARFIGCNVVSSQLEHFDLHKISRAESTSSSGRIFVCDPFEQRSINSALLDAIESQRPEVEAKQPQSTIMRRPSYPKMRSISRETAQVYENTFIRARDS
jgi:glycosyltransferase involved in cell wall biosynthesis